MALAISANIILAAIVLAAVLGLKVWAIGSSHVDRPVAADLRRQAPRPHPSGSRARSGSRRREAVRPFAS
jgi:hypothetical protein